jgi:hypothetical protein
MDKEFEPIEIAVHEIGIQTEGYNGVKKIRIMPKVQDKSYMTSTLSQSPCYLRPDPTIFNQLNDDLFNVEGRKELKSTDGIKRRPIKSMK